MLLVMFINIRYLCISVYIFREFCMSVCRIYESVHIKTGIDLFTKHKAKTSHTNCINCNLVTVLPWVDFFNICHSTYMYMYTAFTQ